jgi:hypothetical protein
MNIFNCTVSATMSYSTNEFHSIMSHYQNAELNYPLAATNQSFENVEKFKNKT